MYNAPNPNALPGAGETLGNSAVRGLVFGRNGELVEGGLCLTLRVIAVVESAAGRELGRRSHTPTTPSLCAFPMSWACLQAPER